MVVKRFAIEPIIFFFSSAHVHVACQASLDIGKTQ